MKNIVERKADEMFGKVTGRTHQRIRRKAATVKAEGEKKIRQTEKVIRSARKKLARKPHDLSRLFGD